MNHDNPDVIWQLLLWHAAPALPPLMATWVWAPSAPHLPPFTFVPFRSITIFMSHDIPDMWWQLLLWHAVPSLPPTMPTSVWAPSAPHLPPFPSIPF
jgi:hypothetical protein